MRRIELWASRPETRILNCYLTTCVESKTKTGKILYLTKNWTKGWVTKHSRTVKCTAFLRNQRQLTFLNKQISSNTLSFSGLRWKMLVRNPSCKPKVALILWINWCKAHPYSLTKLSMTNWKALTLIEFSPRSKSISNI